MIYTYTYSEIPGGSLHSLNPLGSHRDKKCVSLLADNSLVIILSDSQYNLQTVCGGGEEGPLVKWRPFVMQQVLLSVKANER